MSSERLGRLTEALHAYVDDGRLAGAVAIVARHGKIAYLEAVGHRDKESGSPMATDTSRSSTSRTPSAARGDRSVRRQRPTGNPFLERFPLVAGHDERSFAVRRPSTRSSEVAHVSSQKF